MATKKNGISLLKTISTIIISIIFLFVSFFVINNFKSYKVEVTSTVIEKKSLSDMTYAEKQEYYQNFWEDIYYEKNIKPSNEKFYRRFNRAYFFWRLRAGDSQDSLAVLEASKPHLLTTLFLDYSPDNFNSNISEWAENGSLDNIYLDDENFAYQVCDNHINEDGENENDENCNDGSLKDTDYNPFNFINLISLLSRTIADAIAKAQKYLDDMDTVRALGRHLFVYQPVCYLTKQLSDGTLQVVPYEYTKKYSFDEILYLISQATSLEELVNIMPEYGDCMGFDSKWLKRNGGDAIITTFGLTDIVDLCAYYRYLVESDYFEDHAHFKSDFVAIKKYTKTDLEYRVESSKLKVGLARQIIDIVSLSNEDDLVYDTNGSVASGDVATYSLSKSLYITVGNDRTDSSGYKIVGSSLPIDQYVEGVLDAEVLGAFYGTGESNDNVYTALQANAVAIRTYALKVTEEGTKPISNSTSNQVFTDKFLESEEDKYVLARNASLSTANQVLVENGQLIMSEYSSFSKNTNYYCEGDLCYTSYQKIGAKNSGSLHTVIAKKSWGLAGGHNRGMSQWGSLYLAINGYLYQEILEDFYAENVVIANYDYSYKSTDNVSSGEYNVKESMLVCELFTSSQYSDIRELLGDNYTSLEIPLRITSTKYQSSSGYQASSGGTNGRSYSRFSGFHGGVLQKCEWNPEQTALLYRCDLGLGKGFLVGDLGWAKFGSDAGGNAGKYKAYVLDEAGNPTKDKDGNYIYRVTDDPTERIKNLDSSTGVDMYLPNAIVFQYGLNLLGTDIPTEGAWTGHNKNGRTGETTAAGSIPAYAHGLLPTNMTHNPATDTAGNVMTEIVVVGYECGDGYELLADECCLTENTTDCIAATEIKEERVVYEENNTVGDNINAYRYDSNLKGNFETLDLATQWNTILFTGVTNEGAVDIVSDDPSKFWDASFVDNYTYMYVPDYNDLDPLVQKYFTKTINNVLQISSSSFANNLRDSASLVSATGITATDGFINYTEFWEDLGFVNSGGIANSNYINMESHHWNNKCDYYSSNPGEVDLSTLAQNYCCSGLAPGNSKYENYENGRSYESLTKDLGGYFSEAWEIEFCSGTLVGQKLVKAACQIALSSQNACISQCYKDIIEEKALKLGYTKNVNGYWQDRNEKPIYDYTKTAKGCEYNTGDFGAEIPETRKIGPEGECSCALLNEVNT